MVHKAEAPNVTEYGTSPVPPILPSIPLFVGAQFIPDVEALDGPIATANDQKQRVLATARRVGHELYNPEHCMIVDGTDMRDFLRVDVAMNFTWFQDLTPKLQRWNAAMLDRQQQLQEFWRLCRLLENYLDLIKGNPQTDLPVFEDLVREQLFRLEELQEYYLALDRIYDVNKIEADFFRLLYKRLNLFQRDFLNPYVDQYADAAEDAHRAISTCEFIQGEATKAVHVYDLWTQTPLVVFKHRPSTATSTADGKVYVLTY